MKSDCPEVIDTFTSLTDCLGLLITGGATLMVLTLLFVCFFYCWPKLAPAKNLFFL